MDLELVRVWNYTFSRIYNNTKPFQVVLKQNSEIYYLWLYVFLNSTFAFLIHDMYKKIKSYRSFWEGHIHKSIRNEMWVLMILSYRSFWEVNKKRDVNFDDFSANLKSFRLHDWILKYSVSRMESTRGEKSLELNFRRKVNRHKKKCYRKNKITIYKS